MELPIERAPCDAGGTMGGWLGGRAHLDFYVSNQVDEGCSPSWGASKQPPPLAPW